jgi:hypothetical protein
MNKDIDNQLTIEVKGLDIVLAELKSLREEVQILTSKIKNESLSQTMNRKEVAHFLGIGYWSVSIISFQIDKEKGNDKQVLPCQKIGSRFIYQKSHVLDYKEKIEKLRRC